MKKRMALCVVICGLLLIIGLLRNRFAPKATTIILKNMGETSLRDVVLYVSADSYKVGDLGPGSTVELSVYPTSEGGVRIRFRDEADVKKELNGGGYFASDIPAIYRIKLNSNAILARQIEYTSIYSSNVLVQPYREESPDRVSE